MASFYQPPFFEEEAVLDLSVKSSEKRSGGSWSVIQNEMKKRRCDSNNSHTSDYSRGSDDTTESKAAYPTDYRATLAVMQHHIYDGVRNVSPNEASNSGTPEPFLPQQQAIHRILGTFTPKVIQTSPDLPQQGIHRTPGDFLPQRRTPDMSPPQQPIQRRPLTPETSPQQASSAGPSSHVISQMDSAGISTPNGKTKVKATRPFKAYPKNPLNLMGPMNGLVPDMDEEYAVFRQQMLERVYAATGGITSNKNMKRPSQSYSPPSSSQDPAKDSSYRERRRKNNEAAKRSRDARRAKEDELAIRTAFLEQQNAKLTYEAATLREECNRLRSMVYAGN